MDSIVQQQADRLFDIVRMLLAEAKNQRKSTCALISLLSSDNIPEDDKRVEIDYLLQRGTDVIKRHGPQIEKFFEELDDLCKKYPVHQRTESIDISGGIQNMHDQWDIISLSWPIAPDSQGQLPPIGQLLVKLNAVQQSLVELIKQGEIITFPDLVNQSLHDMHIGACLNFYQTFADEFDALEPLEHVWAYLREHSTRINGLMVEPGLIYCASPNRASRIASLFYIIGSVFAGALLPFLLQSLHILSGDPTLHNLLLGYAAVIFGSIVHAFVETFKQYRSSNEVTIAYLDNGLLWIHIKQVNIIAGIVIIWAGFLAYVFIGQGNDWQTAFFVGYSIDSFLELFLVRFTDLASQRTENVAKSLKSGALVRNVGATREVSTKKTTGANIKDDPAVG